MTTRMEIQSEHIRSVGLGHRSDTASVTIGTQVMDGPAAALHRPVNTILSRWDIQFLLAALAARKPYRRVFRVIADTLDELERKAADPGVSPADRVRAADVLHVVRKAIEAAMRERP